jgi:hypothetical protein
MLYRKAPPQPSRLLLRVVAASAGAALVAACSSSGDTRACGGEGVCGSAYNPARDAGEDAAYDGAGGGFGYCDDAGFCGSVGMPGDDSGTVGGGVMVNPDAGSDASHLPGVVPMTDAGRD